MSNQRIWMSKEGLIKICDMSLKHLRNAIGVLDRRPSPQRNKAQAVLYAFEMFIDHLYQIFKPIREEMVKELERRCTEGTSKGERKYARRCVREVQEYQDLTEAEVVGYDLGDKG